MTPNPTPDESAPWYHGITRYQWLVLALASLGWVFDCFEGQIFVAGMNEAMPDLLGGAPPPGEKAFYNNIALASFLIGGALGGVVFGMLSDRIGRKRTMTWTILFYSAFTCVSAFSRNWWQLAGFRFLVALGVGGEWAVASALVAEVFPKRARAWSLGIFHASSVLGTYLAVAAGIFLIGNERIGWRWSFALGALPAVLILWIRKSLKEPEAWERSRAEAEASGARRSGELADLFSPALLRRTLVGVGLASVGLATFWGVHVYGKDRLRAAVEARTLADAGVAAGTPGAEAVLKRDFPRIKNWEMLGLFLATTGGGLGLVSFGPLCERLGRRGAFLLLHLGGLACGLAAFQAVEGIGPLLAFLPVFGFFTLGMHAGYAVYFPELFPTRVRSTGAGFCFNVGRILAAPILFASGWLQRDLGFTLDGACTILSGLFLLGVVLLLFAPETKGQDLPA